MFPWLLVLSSSKRCASAALTKNRGVPLQRPTSASLVVLNQRKDVQAGEFFAAMQEAQLHCKCGAVYFAAQRANELNRGRGGATGGQQIVAEQHILALLHGILVNLQGV